jgi:hypothetical protein
MGGGQTDPCVLLRKGNDYDDDIAIGMEGWVLSCEYRDGAPEVLLCMTPPPFLYSMILKVSYLIIGVSAFAFGFGSWAGGMGAQLSSECIGRSNVRIFDSLVRLFLSFSFFL